MKHHPTFAAPLLSGAFVVLVTATLASIVHADVEHGKLILADDFERKETQEKQDEPGNGWSTNSKTRAQGDKQVDLRDGAMHIFISPKADHAVSVRHEASFTDGTIAMRFMLESPSDNLGLNFADLSYKAVHAGHLFVARIHANRVQLQDLKTGNMDLKIRAARQAKSLTPAQKKLLAAKQKTFPHKLELGKWHDLLLKVEGDSLQLSIDGKQVAAFQSEGISHPTKRMLRLSVPKRAVVDDVKIWRAK